MDQDRIDQLRREAEDRTEEDSAIIHAIQEHLSVAVYQLMTAFGELSTLDDERAITLSASLLTMAQQLDDILEPIVDSIPGTITREEAQEMVAELDESTRQLDLLVRSMQNGTGPKDSEEPKEE